jgi:hypothetical protein
MMRTSAATKCERITADVIAEAWIGDAVLSLYVRGLILSEQGRVDGERSVRMTSNQFLSSLGDPTRVEAEIGRTYEREGLQAAFTWIEENVLPLFRKQEENRRRKQNTT